MISDQISNFILRLLEATKNMKLDWKPISECEKHSDIMMEYIQKNNYSPHEATSIYLDYSINSSYFLSHQNGYIILADIICQNNKNEPIYHKLRLLTKINIYSPIEDDGGYDGINEKLETLKLYVEQYMLEKFSLPEDLYEFWQGIC